MLCLVRKDKHNVWTVYQRQINHSVSFVFFVFFHFFSNWSNCGATLIWVSLFLRGFNMDNTTASEPWTYKLWTYSQGFIRCGSYRTFGVYIFVNWISQVWLQEGQWFALIPGVGGQAASARRRAALPMAAQKAATLIFPMFGLKTGRQSHLSLQHIKQVLCIIA